MNTALPARPFALCHHYGTHPQHAAQGEQAVHRRKRRDALLVQLAGQLADSRAREVAQAAVNASLVERLAWYQASMGAAPTPLRLVPGGPRQRDARLTCR